VQTIRFALVVGRKEMTANDFKIGDRTRFFYNDKFREGTVEKINPSTIVLKLDRDDENKQYKAFSYNKIMNCQKM
jgi:hypothetical protein